MIESITMTFCGEKITVKIGDKFNRLTIIELFKFNGKWYAKCKCDCENYVERILVRSLLTENTKSCGCYNSDLVTQRNQKHGNAYRDNKSRLYKIWVDMHRRCENPNRARAKGYCLKGITVCKEWEEFQPFKEWAFANGYDNSLSIERKDNDKGYCPENCTWIPKSDQSKNRTTNHYITFNGKTQTLTDWSKELDINRTTIQSRLNRGWSIERALNTK